MDIALGCAKRTSERRWTELSFVGAYTVKQALSSAS